mmetsp:Transcript_15597/g.33313  ORF Transcript_15597/g.33313 Transcript_15597/m.33313 type:complete len:328 (-) Transcript_15597:72-1055(-)
MAHARAKRQVLRRPELGVARQYALLELPAVAAVACHVGLGVNGRLHHLGPCGLPAERFRQVSRDRLELAHQILAGEAHARRVAFARGRAARCLHAQLRRDQIHMHLSDWALERLRGDLGLLHVEALPNLAAALLHEHRAVRAHAHHRLVAVRLAHRVLEGRQRDTLLDVLVSGVGGVDGGHEGVKPTPRFRLVNASRHVVRVDQLAGWRDVTRAVEVARSHEGRRKLHRRRDCLHRRLDEQVARQVDRAAAKRVRRRGRPAASASHVPIWHVERPVDGAVEVHGHCEQAHVGRPPLQCIGGARHSRQHAVLGRADDVFKLVWPPRAE